MTTSIIGFPHIGKDRELKFQSEAFFSGKISKDDLLETARAVRRYGWEREKAAGLSFIPSGDFSFYDRVLDIALALHAIPERFAKLGLDPLETYFAMARGYQGSAGDVKALPMKKWFNTNYHYIVPEIEAGAKLFADDENAFVADFKEALALGIETTPTLIGPYTFLHFAKILGERSKESFANEIVEAYAKIIGSVAAAGAKWIFVEEPALVFDLSEKDVSLFKTLHGALLKKIREKSAVKIALSTYFGDVRDAYAAVTELGFDGIGLDFVEGKKSLENLRSGFPKGAKLFAGIVNGKNIWRADYKQKIALLEEIEKIVPKENIVVGTSCSLLHVPYTTASETKVSPDVLKHFAFAEEKLSELRDLDEIFGGNLAALDSNRLLFAKERVQPNAKVVAELKALNDADFKRSPEFAAREKIQHAEFKLPLFPTTTIGSFPQTKDVRANRAAFRKGEISREEYAEFNRQKIKDCIQLQEKIGLDVIVHGEYERNDMVEYFGDHLAGFLFTEKAWVQSYGTRCVKPPIVWGDVSRKESITVEWSVFAQSCTAKPVKGMLTGPVTILNWSFPREDRSLKEQAFQIGLAIREEVLDLEKNGIRIIQIDEAALREKLPLRKGEWHSEYLDWAIPAFRLVHSKVKAQTQIHTHMCYSEFNDIIHDIDEMDADVITFEASRSELRILEALKRANFRTEVGPGVYDIHSPRVPSKEEILEALHRDLEWVDREKLWVNPDCGLKTRGETETVASLSNLVAAAVELRSEISK